MQIQSMAIEMPECVRHPNRLAFRGVLAPVDVPSERPPAGARGHRVVLTRAAAERALPSLLGMGLGYAPALDRHDARRKVGVITSAEIAPSREPRGPSTLVVQGYIFARDFPEVVRELRAGRGELGLSYEVADAQVADLDAAVWVLTEVTFTGAALLKRNKAAYVGTSIELEDPPRRKGHAEEPRGPGAVPAGVSATKHPGLADQDQDASSLLGR